LAANADASARDAADQLAAALNGEGIASKLEPDARETDTSVLKVLVGTKPMS
jgi:hypothetical protein